jgi:hypothetical protein
MRTATTVALATTTIRRRGNPFREVNAEQKQRLFDNIAAAM